MHLSGGECHDGPEGRVSIETVGEAFYCVPMLMDRAYEGDETRELARSKGHEPILPPKKNRKNLWDYDNEKYRRRNVVERCFRSLKEFRKVCTRYDKLDFMFLFSRNFASANLPYHHNCLRTQSVPNARPSCCGLRLLRC
jgi:transposase